MEKRGELTSAQIVMIILAIAGFIIVALFLWGLYAGQNDLTAREICHLSVVERAAIPGIAQDVVSLQCTTEKICISESGREDACKQFAGEKNVRGVKLNEKTEEANAEIIERESANAMYDCWSMMGGGKLDIFPPEDSIGEASGFDFSVKKPKCVICSRVAIADDVFENKGEVIDKVDINDYLANKQVSGSSLTYLQTFTDRGVSSYAGVDIGSETEQEIKRVDELAFIFVQTKTIDPRNAFVDAAAGSVVIGLGGLLTSPGKFIGKAATRALGIYVVPVAIAGILGTGGFAYKQAKASQAISAAYCGNFETRDEKARVGCSIVQVAEWDASVINSLCSGGIEGNL